MDTKPLPPARRWACSFSSSLRTAKHHRPCDATVSLLGDGPTHEGLLPSKHWDLRQVHFRQVYRALPDPWPRSTSGQRARSFGVRSSVVLRTTPFCWLPLGKGVSYERASHAVMRTTRCRQEGPSLHVNCSLCQLEDLSVKWHFQRQRFHGNFQTPHKKCDS